MVQRAALSVDAQTIPCEHIIIRDSSGSPAAGRNAGVERAAGQFILFLDADDTLKPEATEVMLNHWKPGRYVYCDWQRGEKIVRLPDSFPLPDSPQLHTNTCLMSKQIFTRLGGYDPSTDFEDSEFWLRAMARGVCGIRAPFPLFEYAPDGERSAESWQRNSLGLKPIFERYVHMANNCCGKGAAGQPPEDQGTQQPGDILVAANWKPNRIVTGEVTGRKYPRTGWGKRFWADPRDVQASGGLFVPVMDRLSAQDDISISDVKSEIQRLVKRA